jgi:hypothetical protein
MLKIQAESNRYGIELQPEDLAAEAAMAQNLTLSDGGYTPTGHNAIRCTTSWFS